ncbi:MAG: TldD/PmbA family protein [Desulfurococcaceae archaeon]
MNYIEYDNGIVRSIGSTASTGLNLRVLVKGSVAYLAAEELSNNKIKSAIEKAIKLARSSANYSITWDLAERPVTVGLAESKYSIKPEDIDLESKVDLLQYLNGILRSDQLISITLRYGYERDRRFYASSRGDRVECSTRMVGVGIHLVALVEGEYESLSDSASSTAGWEFVKQVNWENYALERRKIVLESINAGRVKPGKYDVILDNEMVGVLLHEAFGHASEGDSIISHESILEGKIGEVVAGDLVTIVDEGVVDGGAFIPYDDEGTPKKKTTIVKSGVLASFLHSLDTAGKLEAEPTGNARAMSHRDPILVRQTNIYMEPRDWELNELIRDTKRGIYIRAIGGGGGEVQPISGAFTFVSGPGYFIENGELSRPIKSAILSGLILETLRNIDAVTRDFSIKTSVFGGCGKFGQVVRTGVGGSHVRVRSTSVGG